MASRKSDSSDAWRGEATRPNGSSALAYGAPAYGAPAYGAPAYGAPAYGAPGHAPQAPAYAAPAAPAIEPPWLVHVSAADQRPMPTDALRAAVQAGAVPPQMLVWRPGMSTWVPVGSVQELMQPAAGYAYDPALVPGPTSAQQAAGQYLSSRGPGLGETTTYAAWDPPEGRSPAPRSHTPAPTQLPSNLPSELMATGMVVFGIVMFTLYMLSLGGAFEAGGHAHAAGHAAAAAPAPR